MLVGREISRLHPLRRAFKRGLWRAAHQLRGPRRRTLRCVDIGRVMERRRRRQTVDFGFDQTGGVASAFVSVGDNDGNRLSVVSDFGAGKGQMKFAGRSLGFGQRSRIERAQTRLVFMRDNFQHTCRRARCRKIETANGAASDR